MRKDPRRPDRTALTPDATRRESRTVDRACPDLQDLVHGQREVVAMTVFVIAVACCVVCAYAIYAAIRHSRERRAIDPR